VFQRQPGNHEKCPICLWEDDLAQLRFPRMPGSANHVSLEQGQHNYAKSAPPNDAIAAKGAAPFEEEPRESSWRPLDPARDNVENRSAASITAIPIRYPTPLSFTTGARLTGGDWRAEEPQGGAEGAVVHGASGEAQRNTRRQALILKHSVMR